MVPLQIVFVGVTCLLLVTFSCHKLTANRNSKIKFFPISLFLVLIIASLIDFHPKPRKIHSPYNWTYELIHLEPLPCPAVVTQSPPNATLTKVSVKNAPLFFQEQEIYDGMSPLGQQVVHITQWPQYGELDIQSRSITYIPSYDFVGCDRIALERTDWSISPPRNVTIIINIMYLISPDLTRPQLDLPQGYLTAEINTTLNAQIRAKFENVEYRQKYPLVDTWYQQKYHSCAIVGNGGILKGSRYGKEIDTHDAVFRINSPDIIGFEEDVGYKITFMWTCSLWKFNCWAFPKGTPDYEQRTEHFHLFGQPVQPQDYDLIVDCKKDLEAKNITLHVMSYQWMNLADAILKEYVNDPTLREDKRRSTGMMAIMAAATICDSVRLYGFGDSPTGIHHYWEDTHGDEMFEIHSFNAEQVLFSDVMRGEGIYKKYLWAYNMTTDLQYVY